MKFKKTILFYCLIIFIQTSQSEEIAVYKNQLIILGELDQKIRTDNIYWDEAISMDKENLSKLKTLIDKYGFPTLSKVGEKGHTAAFLIVQHAVSDKEYMKYFLKEIKNRLGSKEVIDKYYAYLLDRTNQLSGVKQVYGTQGQCFNGKWQANPVDKPEELSKLRKKIGLLPIKDFSIAAFLSQSHH